VNREIESAKSFLVPSGELFVLEVMGADEINR